MSDGEVVREHPDRDWRIVAVEPSIHYDHIYVVEERETDALGNDAWRERQRHQWAGHPGTLEQWVVFLAVKGSRALREVAVPPASNVPLCDDDGEARPTNDDRHGQDVGHSSGDPGADRMDDHAYVSTHMSYGPALQGPG